MNKFYAPLFILIIVFSGCTHIEVVEPEVVEPEVVEPVTEDIVTKIYELDLTVKSIPSKYSELEELTPKYGEVFGVPFFASNKVSDAKLLHGMNILAQYLDNDEDGIPDNTKVMDTLLEGSYGIIMFANENDADRSGVWEIEITEGLQELHADETIIHGSRFDASLEEVFHLVTTEGYSRAYPEIFGEVSGSQLAKIMDNARGGHFENEGSFYEDGEMHQLAVPSSYPTSAWYTYDDETCQYDCMNSEYIYWAMTSILGAQEDRCSDIRREWKLCTREKVRSQDPEIYALLTDPQYSLPTILPDGNYGRIAALITKPGN